MTLKKSTSATPEKSTESTETASQDALGEKKVDPLSVATVDINDEVYNLAKFQINIENIVLLISRTGLIRTIVSINFPI